MTTFAYAEYINEYVHKICGLGDKYFKCYRHK